MEPLQLSFSRYMIQIELYQAGWNIHNALYLYVGNNWFESHPEYWPFYLKYFVVCLSFSMRMLIYYLSNRPRRPPSNLLRAVHDIFLISFDAI
jgi:hypothetical protein